MLDTILKVLVLYIAIAVITDMFLEKHYSDQLFEVNEKYGGGIKAELIICICWPIFWIGYIILLLTDRG